MMFRALWTRRVELCGSQFSHSHRSILSCTAKARVPAPWFVDENGHDPQSLSADSNVNLPQPSGLPADLPDCLLKLHAELYKSPILEKESITISPPIPSEEGPPLPLIKPRGRRQRGGTNFGIGVPDDGFSQWRWIVLAQVKEGTEARGAVESVMRLVRRTLLKADPPIPLPPNRKQRALDGWGMLDAGQFAVHILSPAAREKYFPPDAPSRLWKW